MAEDSSDAIERMTTFGPLRLPVFRRIWVASLFSNFGTLILGVAAAWAMTQLTGRADMVALVQTATFAPMMLISLPAGAIADSYDRRRVAMVALGISLSGALGLSTVTLLGLLTPHILLLFCFIVGTGTALFGPAWQASVGEQVPSHALPQAIALNSISYNIARSFGPAIGGVLVAVAGVLTAFLFNVFAFIPMIMVMYLWRRSPETSRLPPEALGRAVITGIRYAFHSPPIRTVFLRTLLIGLLGSSASALMPLISHDLLDGGASLYGILLGSFGVGAVLGALLISHFRQRLSDEQTMAISLCVAGLGLVGTGMSRSAAVTCILLVFTGNAWMIIMALCNISIQLSSPRWVTGRALAVFSTAVCGGVAIGGWAWGRIASDHGTGQAMIFSGLALLASSAIGLVLRMPRIEEQRDIGTPIEDPHIMLDIKGRSGPIVLTIEYDVDPAQARAFYSVMLDVQLMRQRSGAYGWSLARDIADADLWIERYHTPTWHDYLRQRARLTASDMAIWDRAMAFHRGADLRIQRLLERPFGSVRWTDDVPDRGIIVPLPPQAS